MARDMTLFVDYDRTAYHIFASEENATLHIARLDPSYTRHDGWYVRILEGQWREAPAIIRRKGHYFLVTSGCTGWAPNPASLAVARSLAGPWTVKGDPCSGPNARTTYDSQSTYILPVEGKPDAFIYMGDRWNPKNHIDGRYVWLPIRFKGNDRLEIPWYDQWDLSVFD